jgi:hypothetical protein
MRRIAESGRPVFALTSRVVVRRSADYGVLFLPLRWMLLGRPGLRGLPPVTRARGMRYP